MFIDEHSVKNTTLFGAKISSFEDDVNFQEGDVVIAEVENGRTIVAKVGPVFNTIADLKVMIDGRIFIP